MKSVIISLCLKLTIYMYVIVVYSTAVSYDLYSLAHLLSVLWFHNASNRQS